MTSQFNAEYIQSNSVLTIRFGGSEVINSKLFTDFVDNTSYVLNESALSICPDSNLKLNISAIRPGSFVFDLHAIADAMPLVKDAASIASITVGTYLGLLQIKKLLRGSLPDKTIDSGDDIKIIKNRGTITVNKNTYLLYKKPEINIKVANVFFDLNADGTKNNFEVGSEGRTISIPAADFEDLSFPEPFDQEEKINVESYISETQLKIRKVVLDGRSRWSFYNGTRAIDATVDDVEFIAKVRGSRLSFTNGDRLVVSLRTEYQIDDFGMPVKDTEKFSIVNVHDVIKFEPAIDNQTKLELK